MNNKILFLVATIALLALFRLTQWIPNISPIAAMALFAGAKFSDKKLAFIVPFLALLLSDLVLGFHSTMLFVYGAFAFTVLIGIKISHKQSFLTIALSAIGASLLFFLITNAGVWIMYDTYAAGISGLLESYMAGIPFYRQTLVGDLIFTALLFGSYHLISHKYDLKAA